jgi:hypothetical protein
MYHIGYCSRETKIVFGGDGSIAGIRERGKGALLPIWRQRSSHQIHHHRHPRPLHHLYGVSCPVAKHLT